MRRTFLLCLFALTGWCLCAQVHENLDNRAALAIVLVCHPEDTFSVEIRRAFDSLPQPDLYADCSVPEVRYIDNSTVRGVQEGKNGYCKADFQHALSEREVRANAQYTEDLLNREEVGKQLAAQTAAPAFVLVHDITYVTANQRVETDKVSIKKLGGLLDSFTGSKSKKSAKTADPADSFAGFRLKTHSYLYRLDPATRRLQYVGHAYDFDEKTALKGKYSRTEQVRTLCARSIDRNIVALGCQYDDFKAKPAIFRVLQDERGRANGYAVRIGLREGVSETSKFLVVQPVTDPKTGKTTYRYVAAVKPVKDAIWDNRYNAARERSAGADLQYTTFKRMGGGEIRAGLLLIDGRNAQLVN